MSEGMGIVHNRRRNLYTSAIVVEGGALTLLDADEQTARHDAWGVFLASLARDGGPIEMVTAIEESTPSDGLDAWRYLEDNAVLPPEHPARQSYEAKLTEAGPAARQHKGIVTVTINPEKARRRVALNGGGYLGACKVLAIETAAVERELTAAGVRPVELLTTERICGVLRASLDPPSSHIMRLGGGLEADPDLADPTAADTFARAFRTESGWHISGIFQEFPRANVPLDFMADLILESRMHRRFAFVFRPRPPWEVAEWLERQVMADKMNQRSRESKGLETTGKRELQQESMKRHRDEVNHGAAMHRYQGYVTVTDGSLPAVEEAFEELTQLAAGRSIQIRRLWQRQRFGFLATCPLGAAYA